MYSSECIVHLNIEFTQLEVTAMGDTCFLAELKDNLAVCGCCHTKTKIHRDVQKQYCLFLWLLFDVPFFWACMGLTFYCALSHVYALFFTRVWDWLLF